MSCDPTWYVRLFYCIGVVATYVGIVLLLARTLSDRWHPDGGRNDEGMF